ncbi:hypothetical protein V6N13_145234 [Hibiscus sabdariffa]|uniref:Uncharacterized protein n=1 Tax=Hibiscus sabdariffa TaxID=183260 RepID=A0ABR2FMQ8_9ROSI
MKLFSWTVSFDPKMGTWKSATAGCLTGILRRILCSRTLPTHPTEEANSVASFNRNRHQQFNDASSKVSPGMLQG